MEGILQADAVGLRDQIFRKDEHERSALHYMCVNGCSVELIRLLLEKSQPGHEDGRKIAEEVSWGEGQSSSGMFPWSPSCVRLTHPPAPAHRRWTARR
jgi:hypothetical protein